MRLQLYISQPNTDRVFSMVLRHLFAVDDNAAKLLPFHTVRPANMKIASLLDGLMRSCLDNSAGRAASLGLALVLTACGGGNGTSGSESIGPIPPRAATLGGTARALNVTPIPGAGGAGGGTGTAAPGWQINTQDRAAVELFYRSVYASSLDVPIGWTGNLSTCDAGDTSPEYKAALQRRINWWRAMAGVPAAVELDPSYSRKAQQAALMYAANGVIGHFPPTSSLCWSEEGAQGAGNSSLGNGSPPGGLDRYIEEPGASNNVVGHRLWFLYPQTQRMGSGDAPYSNGSLTWVANAMWVVDSNFSSPRPPVRDSFVAWPAPGFVPYKVVYPRWSFTLPDADFSAATVSMTENGQSLPTTIDARVVTPLGNTLVWLPGAYRDFMVWQRPTSDTRYDVTVANVRVNGAVREFRYAVTVFDADATPAWTAPPTVNGQRISAGISSNFRTTAVPGATAYQWRSTQLVPLVWAEGAESGGTGVILDTAPDYLAISAEANAEGLRAFHLAHTSQGRFADQTITLRPVVVPGQAAELRFASRLGWAGIGQMAIVEASNDDRKTWRELWRQAGTASPGETGFKRVQLPLAALAGSSWQLRFRYAITGFWFQGARAAEGWWIDDLQISGSETPVNTSSATETPGPEQSLRFPTAGRSLIQARPGMFGEWADWGTGLATNVVSAPTEVAQCLFNWAERQYPELLAAPSATQFSAPYLYRAYAGNVYLGLSTTDFNLYLLRNGMLQNLGSQNLWTAQAGC